MILTKWKRAALHPILLMWLGKQKGNNGGWGLQKMEIQKFWPKFQFPFCFPVVCKYTGKQKAQLRTVIMAGFPGLCKFYWLNPSNFWWKWGNLAVAAQAQLACHVTWLDPIHDGEMVWQSVANWTAARVQANMWDQYCTNGSFHGRGANHGQDHDHDCDHEHGQNHGSWHDSLSMALVKLD